MTIQRDIHLENLRTIRSELFGLLEGMDYCLDWKPDPNSWSAREVIYHLVDTPSGGLDTILRGILSGELREFDVTPDLTNLTPERQAGDLQQAQQDLARVLDGIEEVVAGARDEEIATRASVAHLRARGRDEERTAQMLLEGLFARHWRAHLGQLRELRDTLGV